MTDDYWELTTIEEDTINALSAWAISHIDLVDLVELKVHWLKLRIIPDEIFSRFPDYQGFFEAWTASQSPITTVTGHCGNSTYCLEPHNNAIDIIFDDLSPVIIDLDTHQLSIWVIDGGSGKSALVKGLSPINYSRMMSTPEIFPKFIRIGYEYEKSIYNYT